MMRLPTYAAMGWEEVTSMRYRQPALMVSLAVLHCSSVLPVTKMTAANIHQPCKFLAWRNHKCTGVGLGGPSVGMERVRVFSSSLVHAIVDIVLGLTLQSQVLDG
jgi:hypothetical protein